MENTEELQEFVAFLKEKGYNSFEIRYIISIKTQGLLMTKAIYRFNELYSAGKIDGFPDSSIKVLESVFGKKLNRMKEKALFKRVRTLQLCLDSNIDEDSIMESVKYYLGQ